MNFSTPNWNNQPQKDSLPERNTLEPNTTPSTRSAVEIQEWLVSNLANQLKVPTHDIDIQKDFTDYGLNSIEAVNLSGRLENFLDQRLSPTLIWDYPNIQILVQHLSEESISHISDIQSLDNLATAEAQTLLANLDRIPDEDVDRLLNSMLPEQKVP